MRIRRQSQMPSPDSFVAVAITSRSGIDESVHFGAVVALGPSGDIEFAAGDPSAIILPRSANKPLQGVAMVRAGLQLPPDLLALGCASHDGTPMHIDAVRRILTSAGLGPESLGNTAGLPLDPAAAEAVIRAGGSRSPLLMTCSGKHSCMLATCVLHGWPSDTTYLDVDHPLQVAITATIDELSGETHHAIAVDGCGAPAHAYSLAGLARAFRAIATGAAGDAGDQVYAAMTRHPEMVGGDTCQATKIMRGLPGLMVKDGAEGVMAAALPDGRAVALKISDGADRPRPAVLLAGLHALGIDMSEMAPLVEERIMGHGRQVGVVRALVG